MELFRCEIEEKQFLKGPCLYQKGGTQRNNRTCPECDYYTTVISPSRHESQKTSTKPSIKQIKEAEEEKQLDRAEPKTFSRRQFIRWKRIKADPEFISTMGQINNINKRIDDIGENYKKLPATSHKRNDLWNTLNTLNKQLEPLYDTLRKKWVFTNPELANEDIEEKHFREFNPFCDGNVVEVIPCKSAKVIPNPENPDRPMLDADPIYDLWPDTRTGEPRYLMVKIDTKEPVKIIFATLRNFLAPFKVNRRFRETDELVSILEKKAGGKTDAEITREIYHAQGNPAYDKKADRCRKRVIRAHKKIKAKKQ
jgi:hypothetical protein